MHGRRAAPAKKTRCSNTHADTQAYYGRLEKARDLARRATDSAVRADAKETAALWLAYQALREAELGNVAAARQAVARALVLAPGRDVKVLAALALARTGETAQSRTILEALQKSDPTNTYLKVYWFPVIEASIAMAQQAPDRAIVALEPSLPYEFGNVPPSNFSSPMYPRVHSRIGLPLSKEWFGGSCGISEVPRSCRSRAEFPARFARPSPTRPRVCPLR